MNNMMDFESLYAIATQALDSQIIINVQQAERIKELETVMQKCIDAMKGSNCLEEEWLRRALKG